MTSPVCPACGQPVRPQLSLAHPAPETKARRSDPSTSKAAALAALPRAGTQRLRVLEALLSGPKTADEIARWTGISYVSVSTRVSELVTGGWAYRTGETAVTSAGGSGEVVRLTGRAREQLGAERVAA